MTVRGPEGDNSFVLRGPEPQEKMPQAQDGTRAYLAQLGKAIVLFMVLAGFALLGWYTYSKWGWAVFLIPK